MGNKKDLSENTTKIVPAMANLPAYMQNEQATGLEDLKQFVVPPRFKVIQMQAGQELLNRFGAGDVVLMPVQSLVVELPRDAKGRPTEGATASFKIVPLFFYPEWATWNPLEKNGQEPAICYRTTDPTDPIVAKSRNANLRIEPFPGDTSGKLFRRHVEHLNYIVMLYDHELAGTPAVLSFSRGEHGAGTRFASLIKMRNAPVYGGVYAVTVNQRTGKLGNWYGLDVSNPTENPWVQADEYEKFKALHLDFVKLHKEARLKADLGDDDAAPEESAVGVESKEF